MNEGFRLFVYGQLRRGGIGYQRLNLRRHTKWLGRARIHGRLYDLGDYPGLILGGRGVVHGELLGFDDPALWPLLDAYENFDPHRPETSEYRRLEGNLAGGGRIWAYEYALDVKLVPILAHGDWSRK